MTDRFHPPGAAALAEWIARELDRSASIFGIPDPLWHQPDPDNRLSVRIHGRRVGTPIGVAAGPHTQLAQNIVVAWLSGARVIELKTVQTLDRIEVAKPCIAMRDEGYNIEWSQELTVEQSCTEYVTAWILIHALHHRLGFSGPTPEVCFDLSVGYDLAGLRKPNMEWFLTHARDGGEIFERCREAVAGWLPEAREVDIPSRIADSVTISTLHGCPPEEIGAIAEHLLERWGLHTAVKLNPTLLGHKLVHETLVEHLGWARIIPHRPAFDDDIGYDDALELLHHLDRVAANRNLDFGIKLLNTLPVVNQRPEFTTGESTAYLSGRPLHALAVELARRISADFDGDLSISFAGGADAFNTPRLLAAGLRPVTACSDLLRPGGYLRLRQYIENIRSALDDVGATNIDELAPNPEAALHNLERYADTLRTDPEVTAATYLRSDTKSDRELGFFDCVAAPCTEACSVGQGVPEYMRLVAAGSIDEAAAVVVRDNPLPTILGRACHHPCEPVCTRTHLDRPLAIREIKRFITDHGSAAPRTTPMSDEPRVAIVGAGPCGLAAARELATAGVRSTVFERRPEGGGMVSATIPGYRADPDVVRRDLDALAELGVGIELGVEFGSDHPIAGLFERGYRHVIVAVGAQLGVPLGIDGEQMDGVFDGLDLLRRARQWQPVDLGRRTAVIGGGDVAVDCARTALRLGGGQVELIYRRTREQMPAHPEEIRDLLDEGVTIRELVSPRRILGDGSKVTAIECGVMELGPVDASGRPRPVEVDGDGLTIGLDSLIVAIGQRADLSVFGREVPITTGSGYVEVDPETMESSIPGLFVGGDLRHPGPSNIVSACGDGRQIARTILAREGFAVPVSTRGQRAEIDLPNLLRRRSHRRPRAEVQRRSEGRRGGFDEVVLTLDAEAAGTEAARCLDCDLVCSACESVCPNRAIFTYGSRPWFTPHADDSTRFEIAQEPQVAVIADLCNECGNCVTFCPTAGRPWRDKPRLHLHREDFENAEANAFMLLTIDGRAAIQGRFGDRTLQLVDGDVLPFAGPGFSAVLNRESLEVLDHQGDKDLDLEPAFILWTLLQSLTASAPQLPVANPQPEWVLAADPTDW